MSNQGKISIATAKEIHDKVEAVKSLVIGLMGALDEEMNHVDAEDPDGHNLISAGWFTVEKKTLLATFGNAISEEFWQLSHYLKELEKFRDLN